MIRSERSPEFGLPLRYFLAGMVAWLLLAGGTPLLAAHLVAGYDDPQVFALTHLAVLGWVTMTIMGALYQLFPVALQATVPNPGRGRWNFWIYLAGVGGFVPSFFFAWTPGIAIFGTLAVVGVVHFAVNLFHSFRSVTAWHPMAAYVLCSLIWLMVVMGFGLTWALDWQFNWFVISPGMLAAHVHAGLVGWLGCTFMGVSYKLMELFALSHRRRWRTAYTNLGIWNAALLGLVISLLLWPGSRAVVAFASVLWLSAAVFAVDLLRMWRARRRRPISLEQAHVAVSLVSLVLAASLGVLMASGAHLQPNWVVAYGYLVVVGCFGFAIVGKYYKIIPFLTWLNRYSGKPGVISAPLLKDLFDSRLGWTGLALLVIGYAGTGVGLLKAEVWLVAVFGLVYLAGALLDAATLGVTLLPGREVRRSASRSSAIARGAGGEVLFKGPADRSG
ncbi:MAG: hypothetical protein ACREOA_06725 [Candidatus Dormibacteria bacterium]